ncbi:DUF6197 family protein [Candidatus Palauibacter sp.]|uniref:DUF6197 family protein n=2 Tax=Candidatus Palauibacter sp. TaxID=3101350 RepID=UPI003AF224AF
MEPAGRHEYMKASRILRRASALVRRGWIQGDVAADADWCTCDPEDPAAVRWCAVGALQAANDTRPYPGNVLLEMLLEAHVGDAGKWNDTEGRTAAEVAAVMAAVADASNGWDIRQGLGRKLLASP